MLNQIVPLALLNLMRARTRVLLTTSGVLIGTTAVILLIAFSIGLQNAAESGLGSNNALTAIRVTSNGQNPGGGSLLDDGDVKRLNRVSGIKAIIPEVSLQDVLLVAGKYSAYRQVVGIDPALIRYVGTFAPGSASVITRGQGVSGAELGKNFGTSNNGQTDSPVDIDVLTAPLQLQLTKATGTSTSTRNVPVKIVGHLNPGNEYDSMLILPLRDVIAWNEWVMGVKADPANNHYDKITVMVQSRELTRKTSQAIEKLGFTTYSLGDVLDQINSLFTTMRLILGGIGLIALLVAASGVANTMMMATLERIKEIGLMKAVGATDQDILSIFLLEAAFIGLGGGLSGVGVSLILRDVINYALKNPAASAGGSSFIPIDLSKVANPVVIPTDLAVFGVALAVIVCVAAGLYPAFWAARLPPVVALKQD